MPLSSALPLIALAAALASASCVSAPVFRVDPASVEALLEPGLAPLAVPGKVEVSAIARRRESLYGGSYPYEIWEPQRPKRAGTVFLAHGFGRNLAAMRGWARHLASHGIRTVVLSMKNSSPFAGRHDRNAGDLLDLARALEPGRRLYAGFSAGGLASILAASHDEGAAGWLGLDPVDSGGLGASAAALMGTRFAAREAGGRLFALLGESSQCNAQGNFRPILDAAGIPFERVAGATHCHFENPYDPTCAALCGKTLPPEAALAIQAYIRARATRFLLEVLEPLP